VQVHHGNDLNLVANDAIQQRVRESTKDEAPPDAPFDFGPALGRPENGSDAFLDCCFEPFRRVRVARQVSEERGTGFSLRTLLDAELPADHALVAGEDASPGLVPRRERRASAVDVGEALSHLVARATLARSRLLAPRRCRVAGARGAHAPPPEALGPPRRACRPAGS
jgi:hypothetical protein